MKTKVLITGVGGSIGCHVLAHLLVNTNWDIIGVDSFRHKGTPDRISQILEWYPSEKGRVKVIQHNLAVEPTHTLDWLVGHVDYVVNLASLSDVHDSIINPTIFVRNNVDIALTMMKYAKTVKPKMFIQISTDEVYGPTDGKTFHKEWDSIIPSNPYSASKCCQEAICISYWRSYGVPLVIVNLMNNFGEMQSPAKFPVIVQRKVRNGETVYIHTNNGKVGSRFYIHSRNSADALLFILRKVQPNLHQDGEIDRPQRFNIVGDKQVDNLALAQLIARLVGKPLIAEMAPAASSRPGHDIHYGLDGSKLRDLGWSPPHSFEESMARTVAWYEEHPEWLDKQGEGGGN